MIQWWRGGDTGFRFNIVTINLVSGPIYELHQFSNYICTLCIFAIFSLVSYLTYAPCRKHYTRHACTEKASKKTKSQSIEF